MEFFLCFNFRQRVAPSQQTATGQSNWTSVSEMGGQGWLGWLGSFDLAEAEAKANGRLRTQGGGLSEVSSIKHLRKPHIIVGPTLDLAFL